MRSTTLAALLALAASTALTPAWAKTADQCSAEYAANEAKIQGLQSQPDFVAACMAGKELVPGATTAATPAVPPATVAQQPATPAAAAAETTKAGVAAGQPKP